MDVLFVAGEHSGDQHAALIARAVLHQHPDWVVKAVGGPALQRQGVQLLHDLTRHSVVGLVEVLRHFRTYKRLFESLVGWISEVRPRVVVLVDYPGFNLRLADALRRRGVSRKGGGNVAIYQYVSPQIWAWKAGRRFRMAETLDELGAIFPFELEAYRDTRLPVAFVGHPFAQAGYQNPVRYDPQGPLLLLPGSRRQAVARIFPIMVRTAEHLRAQGIERRAVCLYPSDDIHFLLESIIGKMKVSSELIRLRSVETGTTAGAVLTSSGTMSLNCALAGIPGAIVYRAHPLTAWIGRRLIRVPQLGIANLVLERNLYPEFLQEEARPEVLASHVAPILADPEAACGAFAEGARELSERLGSSESTPVVERLEHLADKGSS